MPNRLIQWLAAEGAERRQRLRIRRFFMAFASYFMWYLLAFACWRAGLLAADGVLFGAVGAGILLTQLAFYALFRSGRNLRFRDPSLTIPQILAGLAWALVLVAAARELRGVMLTVYMIALLFGIFALGKRQFLLIGVLAYLGYVGLSVVEIALGMTFFSRGYYLVSVLVLGGVLLWTSMFGSYVSNLRYMLQQRNEELESVLVRMRELADRDDLTGLFNRRVIMDALHKLRARAQRTFEPFSVCIIDLDNFKTVNDAYGHIAGDRVLREFATAMAAELRDMDIVARSDPSFGRYGGEEFILVLPNTDIDGARRCAERLRQRQDERLRRGDTAIPCCTLSAGVAEYLPGEDIEALLRRADHALYAAKHAGRNRVETAAG